MSNHKKGEQYAPTEAARRFEAALCGAFKGPAAPKTLTPKSVKGKPAKASPSSGASRASAKTERP